MIESVENHGFDIDFLYKYIKNEEQSGAELLDYVELGDLKSQERFFNAIQSYGYRENHLELFADFLRLDR